MRSLALPAPFVLALLALPQLGACGPMGTLTLLDPVGSADKAIVNGQVIPITEFPAVGKLTHSGSLCTATLIGKKTVITASHCVTPGATHYFETQGVKYTAAWVKRHPQYNSPYTYDNDVAIVMLSQEPPVAPAFMAIKGPAQGDTITIVGFGKTSEYANDAGTKRKTTNQIGKLTTMHISYYGASGSVGNICNGDSGGPSFATIDGAVVQVGVHSTKDAACGQGGNDIRVDSFQTWIEQTAGGDVNKPGTAPPPTPPTPPPPTPPTPPSPPPGDTTAPQVAITGPAALAEVGPSVTVRTLINDNVGVTKVELYIGGSIAATRSQGPFDFPVTLPMGKQTINVRAYDAAGNRGEATLSLTVVQETPPTDPPPSDPPPTDPPPTDPPPTDPPPTDPPALGSYGDPCTGPSDCRSGLCADDAANSRKFCTERCSAAAPCSGGASCFHTSDPGVQVCGPPLPTAPPTTPAPNDADGGGIKQDLFAGCAVGGSGRTDAGGVGWLVLLFALALRRRQGR